MEDKKLNGQKDKKEIAKQLLEKFSDLINIDLTDSMIQDNKIPFIHEDKQYRIRRPNYKERMEVSKLRTKKLTELLRDESSITQDELIALYKKKGIDINAMSKKIIELQKKIEDLLLRLAEEKDEVSIKRAKEEIYILYREQAVISAEKLDLLAPSIEMQLNELIISYFSYLLLEIEVEDKSEPVKEGSEYPKKWIKVFKTFEDFLADNSPLITKACTYTNKILMSGVEINGI
ncbi:MAG: hypothetical protein ACTSPD_10465 [Promethearchaeota archaeon]